MRVAVLIALALTASSGCAPPVRPVSVPQPVEPFAEDPVSFIVSRRFPPGEVAIVRVCVNPDRTIVSADVIESSGDARFDAMASTWARQVKLRTLPADGTPVRSCGQVRVEIRSPSEPRVMSGSDTSLG